MFTDDSTSGTYTVPSLAQAIELAGQLERLLAYVAADDHPHVADHVRRIRALALGVLDELHELRNTSRPALARTGTDEEPLR